MAPALEGWNRPDERSGRPWRGSPWHAHRKVFGQDQGGIRSYRFSATGDGTLRRAFEQDTEREPAPPSDAPSWQMPRRVVSQDRPSASSRSLGNLAVGPGCHVVRKPGRHRTATRRRHGRRAAAGRCVLAPSFTDGATRTWRGRLGSAPPAAAPGPPRCRAHCRPTPACGPLSPTGPGCRQWAAGEGHGSQSQEGGPVHQRVGPAGQAHVGFAAVSRMPRTPPALTRCLEKV